MHAVLVGFGLGFFVALQLGPMSLFLIRSTLRRGLLIGLSIGAGIAVVEALDATLGVAGAVPLVTVEPVRIALGIVGGVVLVVLGRTHALQRIPRANRRRERCRGLEQEAGVRDGSRRHGVEPVDHRVLGRDLRRRDCGGRGGLGRRCGAAGRRRISRERDLVRPPRGRRGLEQTHVRDRARCELPTERPASA